jgi:glycosyltransferase involved in cell wall biosynthesis
MQQSRSVAGLSQNHAPRQHEVRRPPLGGITLQRRNVLVTIDHLGGGTGTHLVSILPHIQAAGWEPRVLCFGEVAAGLKAPVPTKWLRSLGGFHRFPVAQTYHFIQTTRAVRVGSPTIVHAYFFWPIIITRLLRSIGEISLLVENREDMGFSWGPPEYALLRLTRRWAGEIICVSEAVRRVVVEREGVSEKQTRVVHNGISLTAQTSLPDPAFRKSLGLEGGHFVVGMVANLNRPVKGVDYFLEAMPLILAEVPEARFLIVGGGQLEAALRARACNLGLREQVVFSGYQASTTRYYSVMDVSALTSLSEGISITLLESMSHGLPVVATNVGGNPELVLDGITGLLVPPRDPPRFAAAIVSLARRPDLRRAFGTAARRRVEQHFGLPDVASRYTAVYEGLVSSHHA